MPPKSKEELKKQIEYAMRLVQQAERSCGSASLAETIDIFSKSKLVSAWSTLSNSSMQADLRNMRSVLRDLQADLNTWQTHTHLHAPHDYLDLAADWGLDWNVDWLSWYNLGRISQIQSQCRSVYRSLQELHCSL